MTTLDVSRWQFALTVMFHMIFPAITVGLSVFLSVMYGAYWRTGKQIYLTIFQFWKRIFAVGFAIGVVAGIVITFEFGLNWGRYAADTGPIIAPIIGMEVVTAFFVEAGFIGIMLYGQDRVKRSTMFWSTVMVSIGTVLSTMWILAANSWMQTPAGYAMDGNRFVPVDWAAVIFNPSFVWRFPHMLLAVLIAASLFIAGVSAYYLRKRLNVAFAKKCFVVALGTVAALIPVQLFIGDSIGGVMAAKQSSKFEALEGNWDSTNTGYNFFVIPDQEAERNLVQIEIPYLGSLIQKDPTGNTPIPGLLNTPKDERPDMALAFWGFRVMFFGSMFIFALAMTGTVLKARRKLWAARWFHTFALYTLPLGVIAILGGWVLAETGRQPWVVFGLLRTEDAVSELAPWQVIVSAIGFITLYASLLTAFIVYVVRTVRAGPDSRPGDNSETQVPAKGESAEVTA